MKTFIAFALIVGVFNLIDMLGASALPPNDNFDDRLALAGTSLTTNIDNSGATKESGEPDILGNAGGRSVWWTWMAPQNGTVTLTTEGSHFDTLLAVYTGSSLTNLAEVASGDDTLGPDPLTSSVTFHALSGTVYQIVVDGFQGFNGDVASGNIILNLNFTFDRYTINASINFTNRGAVVLSPAPDPDGKYLAGAQVSISPNPSPGWFFDFWSGDLAGTNGVITLTLTNNLSFSADFEPILIKEVGRSPSGFEIYGVENPLNFQVWCPDVGTLNYRIDTDVAWLSVQPVNGSSQGETNTHQIHIGGLPVGNHLGTVLITPLVEGGKPQSVIVSVRVDAYSLRVKWKTNFVAQGSVSAAQSTLDGGLVVGGTTYGVSDFGTGFDSEDFFVLRWDGNGNRLWAKLFGGMNTETLRSLKQTSDGGFILAGESSSGPSGNKNSPWFGGQDLWVVRLDPQGNKLWDRSFGGIADESVGLVQVMPDGGFILAGNSYSPPSGNKTSTNYGGSDFWVVRLDANGKRLWDQSFGGTSEEALQFLHVVDDGGIFIAGTSFSYATGNKTNLDQGTWIVRLDQNGNKLGELSFYCSVCDAIAIHQAPDKGFYLVREPGYYIARFDDQGSGQWQSYATGWLAPVAILDWQDMPDGGVQLTTTSRGNPYSYTSLRVNRSGQIVRRQTLLPDGGFGALQGSLTPTVMAHTSDGGVVLGGMTINGLTLISLNPQPNAPLASTPVFSSLGFRFLASGESNHAYLTEFSTNLQNWVALQTNVLRGTELEVFDTGATNSAMRFYRNSPLP